MLSKLRQAFHDLRDMRQLPRLEICLHREQATRNDPFFLRLVDEFYADATRRHPKMPLIRAFEIGVAVCILPPSFDDYFMAIEAAGRRNYKKALRLGYECRRIDFNEHLDDILAIVRSTDTRQGRAFERAHDEAIPRCTDPPSLDSAHDYPYFGIFQDGHLWAYCSVFIAGELAKVEAILGHHDRLSDGVVPMLFIDVVRTLRADYPQVKYFAYDTYYGAGETLRRFKRKFGFLPHRVTWKL